MAFARASVSAADDSIGKRWTGFRSRFVYRPAAIWLGWVFIASVISILGLLLTLWYFWQAFEPSQEWLLTAAPYVLLALIPTAFFIAYAGVQYQAAKGFTTVLGDAGTYHVAQQTPLGVLVCKDEFDTFDDPEFSDAISMQKYIGKTVIRNKIVMWGRLGGLWQWPGWAGGKRDGYWGVVYDYWDEIDREIVRGHRYAPEELDRLMQVIPGMRLGTVVVLPYEAWPLRMDEIPEELARAIRDDPEFRRSSRIWYMEDLIPGRIAMGSTMPSNSLVRLWATERTNRILRDRLMEVTMQLAMIRGMTEAEMGGQPSVLQTVLGQQRER